MPIDPTGTAPGLAASPPADETINLKCPQCPSMVAKIIKIGDASESAPPQRLYCCVKCNHTRGVNVGGHFVY